MQETVGTTEGLMLRLVLTDSDAWAGTIHGANGRGESFNGWLDFMSLIDGIRHGGQRISWELPAEED
ncbi:MAG: hypothetical protein ABR598_06350 [Candidatus Dormibacteria bacterium]